MRHPGCFSHFGSPGYHCVGRTRDEREGYRRVELFYHREADAFYSRQTFHGAERTEGIAVGNYTFRQRRPHVPQSLDFLLGRDVQIEWAQWFGRSLLFLLPLWLAQAGLTRGIGSLYLPFKRRSGPCIRRRTAVKAPIGTGRGAQNKDDREEEESFAFGGGRHLPTLSRTSRFSSSKGRGWGHSLP